MHRYFVLGFFACIALVHEAHLPGLAGHFLPRAAQLAHLRLRLLVGRGDNDAQEVAQGIDGDRGLAALALFGPIVAGAVLAFGRALQYTPVEHNGRGRGRPARQHRLQGVQIMPNIFKHTHPASALQLIYRLWGR